MTIEDNIQIVKDFFAAIGQGDKQGVVALCAEDIEWIIPGKGWPLAGTHRGHSGLEDLLEKASELEILYPIPPENVAQGDRASGRQCRYRENQSHESGVQGRLGLRHHCRNSKLTKIREYIDTQAQARASEMSASPRL